jgi:molybdopterin synthase sulfur carrier subunit
MSVSVRIPTILRTYTGGESEVSAEGDTLAAVLDDLDASYAGIKGRILDEAGQLRRFVNVYVGNDDVRFLDDSHARRRADLGDPGGRRGLIRQGARTSTTAALPRPSMRSSATAPSRSRSSVSRASSCGRNQLSMPHRICHERSSQAR